jgi:hypothetical protein
MIRESQTPFKQIAAITLLVLFSYNAVFSHMSLWLWKAYMNEQIEEFAKLLPNEELEEIVLPNTENPEHEIAYNGAMYDVIRYEQEGNITRYFCVKDFTESILSSAQDKDLSIKSTSAKKDWSGHAKQLQKNASAKYIITTNSPNVTANLTKHIFFVFAISILTTSIAIQTPPPNFRMI